jgi:hypothetical protein
MNTTFENVDLLNRVTALAQDVICRPLADLGKKRERCEVLDAELEIAIAAAGPAARFLDNVAPLLLQAIDRALLKRHLNDEDGASDWESLVGALMPKVSRDTGRMIGWLKEVSRG